MLDAHDRYLLTQLAEGLPLCSQPYVQLGLAIGLTETEVITRIAQLQQHGLIKRFGVVVRHRRLGYRANAMIVWRVPETQIAEYGQRISQLPFVTLCYQRPPYPEWDYNLYCMIHGMNKHIVLKQLNELNVLCGLTHAPQQILFSQRCFKQRGALYRL